MLRVFLEFAFIIIVSAWVLAELLSTLVRWSEGHANSKPAMDIEPNSANHPDELGFGTLGPIFAMILLFLFLMPSAVTSNGQTISPYEVSDSMRASRDVGTVATFVSAWRAEDPLEFWGFFAGLLVTVIWLFRKSPALLGVAVIASLFALWLRMNPGILS